MKRVIVFLVAAVVVLGWCVYAFLTPFGDGAGRYRRQGSTSDYTLLRSDGTYDRHDEGRTVTGTYSVRWTTVVLRLPNEKTASYTIRQDGLLDDQGRLWLKEER